MSSRTLPACLVVLVVALGCTTADDGAAAGDVPTTTASPSPSPSPTAEATSTTVETTTTEAETEAPPELPRGGTRLFPDVRMVAHYGNAESTAMGVLGEAPVGEAAERLEPVAQRFATEDRPVLPAFELIVTVAQPVPGPEGTYSLPTPMDRVREWHEAARAADVYLILDLQPGTGTFLEDARRFEDLLREPDVGLALDPEWRMPDGQVPGRTIGTVDAAEINEVSAWLADIVAEENLPEKLFVLHLFVDSMITDRDQVEDRAGLATVFHVDGFGGREVKLQKYDQLKGPFATGFKLFLDEDTNLFEPDDVLAFDHPPDLITYQ